MSAINAATTPTLAQGAAVGAYMIDALINRDGVGALYQARHQASGDPVTLRVYAIAPDSAIPDGASDDKPARFARAIAETVRFRHPGIARIFDTGAHKGQPLLAMERAEHGTLRRKLDRARGARLDLTGALRVAHQLADALQHAHDNGQTHAHLSPETVLLTGDDHTLLIDTGLLQALRAADWDKRLSALANPLTMAPELAAGEAVDARTDVYALGALLYAMLAGRAPYPAASAAELLEAIKSGDAPDLRALRRGIPDEVAELVHKALARDPKDRFPTMYAMQRKLAAALDNAQRARKTGVLAAAAGLAALVVIAGIALQLGWVAAPRIAIFGPAGTAAASTPIAVAAAETATPTATATTPATATPSATPTASATPTLAPTHTPTPAPTHTATPSPTPTAAPTETATASPPPAPTQKPTRAAGNVPITSDRALNNTLRTAVIGAEAERWGRPAEWSKGDRNICAFINSAADSGGERLWRFTVRVLLTNAGKAPLRVLPERFVLRGRNSRPIPACASQSTPIDIDPGQQFEFAIQTFFEGDQPAPYRVDSVAAGQDVCFAPLGPTANFTERALRFGAVACGR